MGNKDLLMLAITNIMTNACKYSSNKPVIVSLASTNNEIVLIIKDQGIGIALEERSKVFDKFYRVGAEQTRTTKGTGLGLYLCKKIVTFHAGQIFVRPNQPKGSIFVVQFKAD